MECSERWDRRRKRDGNYRVICGWFVETRMTKLIQSKNAMGVEKIMFEKKTNDERIVCYQNFSV